MTARNICTVPGCPWPPVADWLLSGTWRPVCWDHDREALAAHPDGVRIVRESP